jgi:hypothetical protein
LDSLPDEPLLAGLPVLERGREPLLLRALDLRLVLVALRLVLVVLRLVLVVLRLVPVLRPVAALRPVVALRVVAALRPVVALRLVAVLRLALLLAVVLRVVFFALLAAVLPRFAADRADDFAAPRRAELLAVVRLPAAARPPVLRAVAFLPVDFFAFVALAISSS